MTGNRILVLAAWTFGAGACTTGNGGNMVTEGITCMANLNVTGGMFAGAAPGCTANGGSASCECAPYGMWTFTVAVDASNNTCGGTVPLLSSYSFAVTATTDSATGDTLPTYAYTDPQNMFPHYLLNTSSNGTCYGNLSLYSADGKTVWSFQPVAAAQPTPGQSTTLSGDGLYRIYATDQWVGM